MDGARLRCAGLVSAVLLFAAVAQSQVGSVDRLSRLPELPARTEHVQRAAPDVASDYSESVLYTFCSAGSPCADGSQPIADVIQDAAGNLYGTTHGGGANGAGTVFELTPPPLPGGIWTETQLYSFCAVGGSSCTDGNEPGAGLIEDAEGNLYGTTMGGGARNQGAVFELTPPPPAGGIWTEKVVYSFCSAGGAYCTDGSQPVAGLVRDPAGNLYGTTESGGASPSNPNISGTVFEVFATGGETVLYRFCSHVVGGLCADGTRPVAGLIRDAEGNLYGTTEQGGPNLRAGEVGGEVFEVTPPAMPGGAWGMKVLYGFCSVVGSTGYCTDGASPEASLLQDAAGNLYGTTANGGFANGGTVFEVYATGGETVLYDFCSENSCLDGGSPRAGLIQDAAGNLYGTTIEGGANSGGTVFEVYATGGQTLLYSFCSILNSVENCSDGESPLASLLEDASGNLYGTTYAGSATTNGLGTVFELKPPPPGTTAQTISFANPGPLTYGAAPTALMATASSGLPVSFAVTSGAAIVSGITLLTGTGAGSVTVRATQAGNSTYAAATPVSDVITVLPASLTVTAESGAVDYGWPIPVLTGTLAGVAPGDGITASYTTTAIQGSAAGPYPIIPKLNDPNGRLPNYTVTSTNGTLTIRPQSSSVPLLLSLSPGSALAGGGNFTLTVNGANFDSGAVVLWNGAVRTTQFASSTQVTATILAGDIAAGGTALVTVANPPPNAGTSAAQPFGVTAK